MEIWWGREWKAVSKVWNWEWCKDGERACARIGRQGENAVHLMRWTNSLWAWTGLVQIWTAAKLKNSVSYAQVSLKAGQTFVHGFGRRWRTWSGRKINNYQLRFPTGLVCVKVLWKSPTWQLFVWLRHGMDRKIFPKAWEDLCSV